MGYYYFLENSFQLLDAISIIPLEQAVYLSI